MGSGGICYSLPTSDQTRGPAVPGPSPVMFRVSEEKTKLLTHFPGTVEVTVFDVLEGKHAGLCTHRHERDRAPPASAMRN